MFAQEEFQDVLKKFDVNPTQGLTNEEVFKRQEQYGLNSLQTQKKVSWIIKFLGEFKDVLIIILIIAAIISVIVEPKDWVESVIILFVVLVNAILGVTQESKAEKSLEALKKLSSPLSKVIRSGNLTQIDSSNLVPGDIIVIEAGDFVPADARIIEAHNLQVDESALTGESVPVNKTSKVIKENHISLGDQKNMLFSSTFTTYGRGIAVVTATGMDTEIGKIAQMLNVTKAEQTPLQIKLTQIGKTIGILAIAICIIIFLMEWLSQSEGILDAFKTSVALAVAAIPEGLSTVVTVVLAIGVGKMARRKAIVKKLTAVETLGSTSVVCSDKTGTLTQNKMTVVKLYQSTLKDPSEDLTTEEKEMLSFFALCSDAKITIENNVEKRIGDPTETALIAVNNQYGLIRSNLNEDNQRIGLLPFDSDRKMMSVIVKYQNKSILITKGAVDVIINRSVNVDKEKILSINEEMASQALRVLALGIRWLDEIPEELESESLERDLTFVGLVGMIDPARIEVYDAIHIAKEAGIKTVMITGDHVTTARAIAQELGIIGEDECTITSEELHKLSDDELFNNIEKYAVYARVAPEDKVRIVKAWQRKGKVVAMTGDGVNDSPALKAADIGCAMGITGTDVAKEAAAMILVDDNFATIIAAVNEGRGIYRNIKNTVKYLLSSNIGEVITIFLASIITSIGFINLGVPLLPIHLLWINLITDSLPAFALGLEQAGEDIMKEKPRDKNESFFTQGMGLNIFIQGLAISLLTLLAYIIGHKANPNSYLGHTMAFFTLSSIQLFHAFNLKSNKTVFSRSTFNNGYLIFAFIVGIGLQLMLIYTPFLADLFKLESLGIKYLLICLGLSFVIIIFNEILKLFHRNK